MKTVFLPVELWQILLPAVLFFIMMLLRGKFQFGGDVLEKMAGPPRTPTEVSRKELMEALGLPESVVPPDPLSKKELPLPERLSSAPPPSKKSWQPIGATPSLVEEKTAWQTRQQPSSSFQVLDQASLRHAIVAREVLGPPKTFAALLGGALDTR